jgi:HK97 family phage major capsid protein
MPITRTTSNVALPVEVSSEIWAKTLEDSAFMQLSRHITIPGTGTTVQTITGEPQANWVAEANAKPVSDHTFGKKVITPYKLAVIEAFSDEFRRDKAALYAELVRRLPYALAAKFDATIMGTSAPGTGFDVLGGCTKVSLIPAQGKTVYDQFLAVDTNVSTAGGIMNGIALAPQGRAKVLSAVDQTNHPLFTAGVQSGTIQPILGASVVTKNGIYVAGSAGSPGTPAIVGIAGDFTKAIYGTVEGIQIAVSDQASLTSGNTTINLWQQNMFAVRAEVEVAFAVEGTGYFNLLTGDTPSA